MTSECSEAPQVLAAWYEANKERFAPPICNKLMHKKQLTVTLNDTKDMQDIGEAYKSLADGAGVAVLVKDVGGEPLTASLGEGDSDVDDPVRRGALDGHGSVGHGVSYKSAS